MEHGGGERCEEEGCTKLAERGMGFCIAHAGGCQQEDRPTPMNVDNAGGAMGEPSRQAQQKTAQKPSHAQAAADAALYSANIAAAAKDGASPCASGAEGRRCQHEGCPKRAASGGTLHCVAHGGGKRCEEQDCTKSAQGGMGFCVLHGGGRRCQHEGCLTSAVSRGTPH